MSKANNLTICEIQRSTKKPRRLLHSALDVISVTRRKARRASEIESPMSPRRSFGEAWIAKALSNTEEPKYAIGARAAIVRWNRERGSLSVLSLSERRGSKIVLWDSGCVRENTRLSSVTVRLFTADQVLKQVLECCRFDQERGLGMSYSEMLFVSVAPNRMKHSC